MTALEILAPARNADIGIAAIRCGADAVYIGGPAFGARAAAGNSVEEIVRLCDYASRFGARVFVTVNTLCRDDGEREEMVQMMCSLRDKGVSAFIMQDCTLLPLLAACGPWREEFHASTQCAIRTPQRAQFLSELGFTRLVLERELPLETVLQIHEAVPEMELEFFVHGALCVCYSGDCYLSEALCSRSANRGECAQPCRSLYDLLDGDGRVLASGEPLLSLKDYKLIDRLEDLARAGVVSFKIEGRLKNETYVKNVVRAYSQALDEVIAQNPGMWCRSSYGRVSGGFTPDLGKSFNRGYTSLFIDGKRGAWHSEYAAKHIGEYIGQTIGGDGRRYIEFPVSVVQRMALVNGDGLCFVGRDSEVVGFRADRIEGGRVFCKAPSSVPAGTRIWRNRDLAFEKALEKEPVRMLDVDLYLDFGLVPKEDPTRAATTLKVEARREDGVRLNFSYPLEGFDVAGDKGRMLQVMESQLSKSGGDCLFRVAGIIHNGPIAFMSASFLNGIRREIAEAFAALPVLWAQAGWRAAAAKAAGTIPAPSNLADMDYSELVEDGSLVHPRREGELMRSKYCIRYRMGLCSKKQMRLFLRNNGRIIPLYFDCRNCEMVVGSIPEN